MTSTFSILGEWYRKVRSTPMPLVTRRTVKFEDEPCFLRRMTTPSKTWVRSRSPSTMTGVDANGVAGLKFFDARIALKGQEIAAVHDQLRHRRLG